MKRLPVDWFLRIRLKLRHLQLFLALDDHRNLHRAAASLHISQPAASKLLGEVEEMLDVRLFERLPRGVEPNTYGEILIRHARMILSQLAQAGEEIESLNRGDSGVTSIGTVNAPAVELVAPAVERVHRLQPRLQINVQVDTSDVLAQRVLDGKLDFALARIPVDFDPAAFFYDEISDEKLCFICRAGHPLLAREAVTLSDLDGHSWVLQPRGTLLRRKIDEMFRSRAQPLPERVITTASVMVTMAVVGKTDALSVIPVAVAALYRSPGRYAVLPFAEPFAVEPFGVLRLKDRALSPGALTLLRAIGAIAWPGRAALVR
ncbi:MAG TPA: LysR family transcriptional regulator [Stellaceae bacterium]|nr:LysR family transcriptional regulator [Stellaceae bacterium]